MELWEIYMDCIEIQNVIILTNYHMSCVQQKQIFNIFVSTTPLDITLTCQSCRLQMYQRPYHQPKEGLQSGQLFELFEALTRFRLYKSILPLT